MILSSKERYRWFMAYINPVSTLRHWRCSAHVDDICMHIVYISAWGLFLQVKIHQNSGICHMGASMGEIDNAQVWSQEEVYYHEKCYTYN